MDLLIWRHPLPLGARGRCIGRTDLPVDPRRSKRLAHRIRRAARRSGRPRVVWTSPLRRCADVGRWLARWGWRHVRDPRLLELDFGRWDGQPWQAIPVAEIDAWCDDFARHPPGQGEPLAALWARCADVLGELSGQGIHVVGHGGWMQAARAMAQGLPLPEVAGQWGPAPRYGQCLRLPQGLVRPAAALVSSR